MGAINSYSDDAATTDSDRFLTYASDGTTKLTPASNVNKYIGPGWVLSGDTWTYSSWSSTNRTGVINTNSGATTKYSNGMRVMFTQATLGTKYGIITAVTTSTITVYFGTDYQLDNETISSPVYSGIKAPFGFPLDPSKWTQTFTSTSSAALSGSAVWQNAGSLLLSIPIGVWNISAQVSVDATRSAATAIAVMAALSESTSATQAAYIDTIGSFTAGGASGTQRLAPTFKPYITKGYTTATTVYLIVYAVMTSAVLSPGSDNSMQHTIRAVNAYL